MSPAWDGGGGGGGLASIIIPVIEEEGGLPEGGSVPVSDDLPVKMTVAMTMANEGRMKRRRKKQYYLPQPERIEKRREEKWQWETAQ